MTELERLIKEIDRCKELYYNSGTSPLNDEQYDAMVRKAERLGFIDYVGSKPVESITIVGHDHPMLSLEKCHTIGEIIKFAGSHDIIMMLKLDGLSVSATYIDGVLARLETRGNGFVGNDVLFHANSFENLPKYIDKPGKYVVDGECIIRQQDFEAIQGDYSNPRNLAAGSLNQLDPAISAQRHLRFVAWDVITGGLSNYSNRNLDEASELGFDVVPYLIGEDTKSYMLEISLESLRDMTSRLGYPCDGVVIRLNDIEYGKSLGVTSRYPKNSIAYKYANESYETRLDHIEWNVGKTSQITPVAVFDPVMIDNTEINRASLHNLSIIKGLGLTEHCTVYVAKMNEIIPQIVGCENDGDGEIESPKKCPVCNGHVRILRQNNSETLECSNPNCKGRLLGKLSHFVSKSGLDIKGLSEQTLETLIEIGAVESFEDIFKLKLWENRLKSLPGFGEKSVKKLLASIDDAKSHVDLAHFICALSISEVGLSTAKILANRFKTWDAFYSAEQEGFDFSVLENIGKITGENIKYYLINYGSDADVVAGYCTFNIQSGGGTGDTSVDVLHGKTFVVTGSVHHFKNRDELKAKIESLGGKVSNSVSKNTDYLINNDLDSSSSKNTKAKQLNVPIITEDEFLAMIE